MAKTTFIAEPGKQELVLTREFEAPRELVFQAFTDRELIPQWWGPKRLTTTVDEMDVRAGGRWRFIHQDGDNMYAFHGVYHDVVAPERIVYTFEFEGMPGHVLLETVTFSEHDGKTTLTDQSVFQSVADRDGMVSSGMEEGASESMARFGQLVHELKAAQGVR
ncbi:MAG: SRPBCC family protein [Herpetosiphon sp.]